MLKKKFLKTKCKVEFSLADEVSAEAETVFLVGDFNDWDESATPMKKKKDYFTVTLDLQLNQEYQFRYFVNNLEWHNDWHADEYTANPFGGENSVVVTFNEES